MNAPTHEPINWYAIEPHEASRAVPKTEEDYQKVKAKIQTTGFNPHVSQIAVWRDPKDGRIWIIDGASRHKACLELGHKFTDRDFKVLPVTTDPWAYSIAANVDRRQLDTKGKRQLIMTMLERFPGESDNAMARRCSVDPKTVKSVKDELAKRLETACEMFAALNAEQRTEFLRRIGAEIPRRS
jgi:hypothetical protein